MNIAEEIKTVTAEELSAAFVESRLKFTKGYGLLTALQKPVIRRALELHALSIRYRQRDQNGEPAPMKRAA
ncbi:hypothetical protein GALL_71660 [mine drainage metagenome]|uniref:Uncharacterized protein n=1 Tax=mine drainage metagenome TaxID=410659 RepID=A0A1J5SSN0_9ZZZZ